MARQLKVFRTAIGFHDAYVAAPSRAAALRAWGASRDLFGRGVAEEVTDAALMEEPLAHPGEVIRRSRGTAEEQIAALPDTPVTARRADRTEAEAPVRRRGKARQTASMAAEPQPAPKPARKAQPQPKPEPRPKPTPEPRPRPSRAALDRAEAAVADAEARSAAARREIEARQAALDRDRRALAAAEDREGAALEAARAAAERDFAAAMRAWRAG